MEFQALYKRIPENYLKAIPQKVIENATVEMCASSCVMEVEFECKSFDIDNRNRECHLHNHTHREPLIGLQHARGFDHYRSKISRMSLILNISKYFITFNLFCLIKYDFIQKESTKASRFLNLKISCTYHFCLAEYFINFNR